MRSPLASEREHRGAVVLDDVAGAGGERRAPEGLCADVRREREEDALAVVPLEHARSRAAADALPARLRRDVEVEDLEVALRRHRIREDREVLADDREADRRAVRPD